MSDEAIPFLGTGWSFPPQFTQGGKNIDTTQNATNVHKSILILLQTDIGERVMQEDFGGSLLPFQFEQINTRLLNNIKERITKSIEIHEPRVILDGIEIQQDEQNAGLLLVRLQYTIRTINTSFNMVYPFYINQ